MASAAPQFFPPVIDPSMVGNAFVIQYYHILHHSPEYLFQFYQNFSRVGRPGPDEKMQVFTTLPAINDNLLLLAYGDCRAAEIISVDSQESYNGGVLVVVTGYFPLYQQNIKRKFIQTFFLAPQENGYFVLNDIFRLFNEAKSIDGDIVSRKASDKPVPPSIVTSEGDNASEKPASTWVNPGDEEADEPLDNGNPSAMEEKAPVPDIANEVPEPGITSKELSDDPQEVSEPENGPEDVPKISYASVVSGQTVMKETTRVLPAPPPPKPVSIDQDQQVASDPPVVKPDLVPVAADTIEGDKQNFEVEAEGASIYVKGLPSNATLAMLENGFKQFGTIRSDGIQVKHQRGFAFGFVEFEEASAAQRAIEASPVIIGGRKTIVEEKKSTSRGNRGRPSSGQGDGYRSEGVRGRGGYRGGRGYGREYGNRGGGGYSNRRGHGYQRTEGGGGRMSRGAYVSVNNNNTTETTLESDVPASA